MQELNVVHQDSEPVDLDVPYQAGFLGFREVPTFAKLIERCPKPWPQARPVCLPASCCVRLSQLQPETRMECASEDRRCVGFSLRHETYFGTASGGLPANRAAANGTKPTVPCLNE